MLFFFFAIAAEAQTVPFDSVAYQRATINRQGMKVLAGWALLNIASGLAGQRRTAGEQQYFHQMNAIWGSVNLALAGIGYFAGRRVAPDGADGLWQKQVLVEKIFLFNTALDLSYMAYGLYTRERGFRFTGEKRDRLRGFGKALLMQGGFLAVFDGVMYWLHTKNGTRLRKRLPDFAMEATGGGAGLVFRF